MTTLTEPRCRHESHEECGECQEETRPPRPYLVARRKWLPRFRDSGPHVHEFLLTMMILSSYADEKGLGHCPHASVFAKHVNLSEEMTAHYLSLGTRYGWVRRSLPDDLREPFRFRLTSPPVGYVKESWSQW